LKTDDLEVYQTESLTTSTTVLMLDLSISMPAYHHFDTAKRLAVSLDSIIRNRYRQDSLYLIGFSTYARQLKKEDLSAIAWDEVDSYTNIQHGLSIARKLLAPEKCSNKQILMVSDGEPTAGVDENNRIFYESPAGLRILDFTLDEVRRCTREGIRINIFMLEQDAALTDFVNQVAHINKGRVFFTFDDNLGQYLLLDYVTTRRKILN
jgi:uncharacterized protein with von Willebrand factor type A (vWA) domain